MEDKYKPEQYKSYSQWIGRSSAEYEVEIKNLKDQIKKLEHSPTRWGQPVWEQIAHELVYGISIVEDNPTSPKAWRKLYNIIEVYENAVRTGVE